MKRATAVEHLTVALIKHFNPRPREEGDSKSLARPGKSSNFNPRPREEGDLSALVAAPPTDISIHALVKRATRKRSTADGAQAISIHALVKRATML